MSICVALDTETTAIGKDGSTPQAVEIAFVQFDDENGRIHGMQSLTVECPAMVKPGAELVHRITEDLKCRVGVREGAAIAALSDVLLTCRKAIAFNSEFDRKVLRGICERNGYSATLIDRPHLTWVDLMRDAQGVTRIERESGDFKWPSMDETLAKLRISLSRQTHTALADSFTAMSIYMRLKDEGLIEERDAA